MKVKYYILLLILLIISCAKENARINSFNNKLPNTDRKVLESWVNFFNKLLKDNYQESGTKQLLKDIRNDRTSNWKYDKRELCELLSEFQESSLELKGERLKYDTVYIGQSIMTNDPNDTMVITVTQEQDTNEQLEVLYGDNSWDVQVKKTINDGYWNLIDESSFVKALKHNKNPAEINNYIETRETIGKWSYLKMAESIGEDNTINLEDFFIKRIIVFEIISEHMKQKHGC